MSEKQAKALIQSQITAYRDRAGKETDKNAVKMYAEMADNLQKILDTWDQNKL